MEELKKKELVESLVTRGVENIIPGKEKLVELLNSGKTLNVYLGIDPTATRIHLGHAFPLRKLQILADLGHNVTFLIGDFTAKVGDTSDKETERPILTDEEIKNNFETYKRQASKLLDFSKVTVVHNSEWLSRLNFAEVLKLTQNFSLNDFISRELISKRLKEGKRVSLPETLYPIMQGYDSYHLDTDIQLGGTDQTFNMQAGRTLLWNLKQKESFVMANGFLPGTDGRKMSKTWDNAIWLEDKSEEIYKKVMAISDEVVMTYFEMATNLSNEEIQKYAKRLSGGENPMFIKRDLAKQIATELCGASEAEKADKVYVSRATERTASDVDPIHVVASSSLPIFGSGASLSAYALEDGHVDSNSQFKDRLRSGGIFVNDKKISETDQMVELVTGENSIRFGNQKFSKVIRKDESK